MVEQLICNQQVAGSSPVLGSSNLGLDSREGYPSGQRGQTVNLLAKPSKVRILLPPPCRGMEQLVARRAHNPKVAGSNPAPATIALKRPEGAEIRSPTILQPLNKWVRLGRGLRQVVPSGYLKS